MSNLVRSNGVMIYENEHDSVVNSNGNSTSNNIVPQKYLDSLSVLCTKYANDSFMMAKLDNLVTHQLQIMLENIDKSRVEREQRIDELTQEQDQFIQTFFSKHRYLYMTSADHFFNYDGVHFTHVTEDAVLHNILSSISRDRGGLMSWKYKTKSVVMKRIRENTVQTCIPESSTIQTVINALYPAYFASKVEAKYFLTVLGDNILKTQPTLLHIIGANAKPFLDRLNFVCRLWFGTNLNQTFKYKCHSDHDHSALRLLSFQLPDADDAHAWLNGPIGLDLLCVACHYSYRYGSADTYLAKYSNNDTVLKYVMYLSNRTPAQLVEKFIQEYLTKPVVAVDSTVTTVIATPIVTSTTTLDWKHMQYLWKHFLTALSLPNPVSSVQLKNIMTQLLEGHYSADADNFVGITSRYLPSVKLFLKFWNDNMVLDPTELELEISEIAILYKRWCNDQTHIGESQILNIITHFFPDVEVDEGKYVYKVRCALWDKQADIMTALADIPAEQTMSVYDAYAFYCGFYKETAEGGPLTTGRRKRRPSNGTLESVSMVASKQYFEKYLSLTGNIRFINEA